LGRWQSLWTRVYAISHAREDVIPQVWSDQGEGLGINRIDVGSKRYGRTENRNPLESEPYRGMAPVAALVSRRVHL